MTREEMHDQARKAATEASYLAPDVDDGSGTLYTIALCAIEQEGSVTAERVVEIAREAKREWQAER